MEVIKVIKESLYRDGGSCDLVDREGNKYWMDRSIGTKIKNDGSYGLIRPGDPYMEPLPEPIRDKQFVCIRGWDTEEIEELLPQSIKKSETLKKEAAQEDNDLKAMGLYIKSDREKRGEDFKEDYLPKLLELDYHVEVDDGFTKYSITTILFGIVDFFPKKNKLLIRRINEWKPNGRQWITNNLLKDEQAK